MFHVDNSTGVPVMPQPSPVISETALFFIEGGNGVPPTYPGPDWFNIIQSELLNILMSAGLKPDKMTNTQILTALKKLFLSRSNPFGDIKADGAEAIAKALQNLGLGDATKAVIHTGKIIADLNAPPKNSTGFAYHDAQNSPGFNATVLTVDSIEGSYDIQIAIGYNPLKFAFRAYSGDAKVWLNWVVLGNAAAKNTGTTAGTVAAGDDSRITGAIQRNAMVGAVSQTGGAPTGAIIERGSNSNGEYTKFADGTLICWFTRSAESTANNSSGGTTNLYFSSEVGLTFPATFVGITPTVTPSASLSSGGTSSWPSVRGRSLTGTSLALISNVQNAAAYLGYTAIGRWF